jgi:hypothetical protein
MALHFLTFDGANAFQQYIPLWEDLLDRVRASLEAPDYFLSASWLNPWLHHRGSHEKFFWAVLAEQGTNRWVAALPMSVARNSQFGTSLRHLVVAGYPESDCVFIPAESNGARTQLVSQILNHWEAKMEKVVACDFREIPNGGPTQGALEACAQEGSRRPIFQIVAKSPRYSLEDFIASGSKTTGKLGRNLRRSLRILNEAGKPQFHFDLVSAEEAEDKLNLCRRLESESWKGSQDVGALTEVNLPFIADVWENLIRDGQLALGILTLDGKPIAYHWGMVHRGVFLSYNLAQISSADSLSPGTLLLDHMIQNASALGIREFDASRGGLNHNHSLAYYKGPTRWHSRVFLCRRSALGRLIAWKVRRRISEQVATCKD